MQHWFKIDGVFWTGTVAVRAEHTFICSNNKALAANLKQCMGAPRYTFTAEIAFLFIYYRYVFHFYFLYIAQLAVRFQYTGLLRLITD